MGAGLRGVGRRNDAKRHIGGGGLKIAEKVSHIFLCPLMCVPQQFQQLKKFLGLTKIGCQTGNKNTINLHLKFECDKNITK
jgi:hypothetical protein